MSVAGSVNLGCFNVTIGGLPAARKTDLAAHTGPIVSGAATVSIAKLSAARVTDRFTCPMSDGPKPHVGGMILPPCCVTVTIEKLPAARISDLTICTGPPVSGKEGGGEATDPEAAKKTEKMDCRGKPLHDQEAPHSCVVASTRMIMEEMAPYKKDANGKILKDKDGKPIRDVPSEAELQKKAARYPLYYDGTGSDPYGIPEFLDQNGIPGSESRTFNQPYESKREELNKKIDESNNLKGIYNDTLQRKKKRTFYDLHDYDKDLKHWDQRSNDKQAEVETARKDAGKAFSKTQDDALDFIKKATDPGPPTGKPAMVGVDRFDPHEEPPSACHRLIVDGVTDDGTVLLRDPMVPAPEGCTSMTTAQFKKQFDPRSPIVTFPDRTLTPSSMPPQRANKFGI